MRIHLVCCFILLSLFSCSSDSTFSEGNKFDDEVLRMIADHQDRRNAPGLVTMLVHDNPVYRSEAVLALASVQDSATCGVLSGSLQDPDERVRESAAYVIGQLGDSTCAASLRLAITENTDPDVIAVSLEALGKIGTFEDITFLEGYESEDPVVVEGLAWALARLGLRNMGTRPLADKAMGLLSTESNAETRLAAAHMLFRSKELLLDSIRLISLIEDEHDTEVRMALVGALKHVDSTARLEPIRAAMRDEDHRIRINAINAMHKSNFDKHLAFITEHLLADANPNVVVATAEKLAQFNYPEQWYAISGTVQNSRAANTLLSGAYQLSEEPLKSEIRSVIMDKYGQSDDAQKILLLNALSGDLTLWEFLETEALNPENGLPVREAAVSAIGMSIFNDPSVVDGETALQLDEFFTRIIKSGEYNMLGWGTYFFRSVDYGYRDRVRDYTWMEELIDTLDSESDALIIGEIERTLAFLNGIDELDAEESAAVRKGIDWDVVAEIGSGKRILISTSKGDIVLELAVEQSPSSAANFYTLVKRGYYDNTAFHRVVPNFVIQAGRPSDDVEAINYTIRSELGPAKYVTGAVGMASAGKDTEGSQWFITHSPTPHLDGRYSIFAYVMEGMDVVQQIELEDRILEMSVLE